GAGLTLAAEKAGVALLGAISFSASTFGAGMIVGARIGVPAIVVGLICLALTPWLREAGLLGPHDPWRKVGFLISLGTILGAAIVDITLVVRQALARHRSSAPAELADPLVGLIAGSNLLISTVVGDDMQQDRSTGWRLGTNRTIQFRYQVIGILMGAVFAVVITKLFLAPYPVLRVHTFLHLEMKTGNWQSAMTYKFAGVLRGLSSAETTTLKLMGLGIAIGLVIQIIRVALRRS